MALSESPESARPTAEDLARLSIGGRRGGRPRTDPTNRLLHRFYEPLVLLRLLNPTRGMQNSHLSQDSKPDTLQDLRRKFLDQLSWTCDSKPGGDTVAAIAAEANPEGTIFWLAANTDPTKKVRPHLELILKQLEQSFNASEQETEELELSLTARCIEFSKDKVKYYSRQLCFLIGDCVKLLANQPDAQLLEDLRKLETLRNSHSELCSLAYSFRGSDLLEKLTQRHAAATVPSAWSKLRHYIGRLGSWSRASKTLVLVAKQLPNLLTDFQIKHLVSPPPIAAPAADAKTNLDSALGRMFPKDQSQHLQEIREMVRNFKVFDISAEFLETYTDKTFRPRIHAELFLLEHFHQHNLEFVENDRYIGCSKPSCYCCDLYMRCHPGNFVRRACHGNLWINWRAPIPPVADDQVASRHTAKMLNEMVKSVRQDALDQLRSKQPRRPRVPDSTTGMSTSISVPRRAFLTTPSPNIQQLRADTFGISSERNLRGRNQETASSIESSMGNGTRRGSSENLQASLTHEHNPIVNVVDVGSDLEDDAVMSRGYNKL